MRDANRKAMWAKKAKYRRGFKEGFNNPSQFGDKLLNIENPSDYVTGVIDGKVKRMLLRSKGFNRFIWSDEDLKKEIREDD